MMKSLSVQPCNLYQESIYFHWKQNPLSDAYHLPFIYEINGLFRVDDFVACCHTLFKSRHAFGLKFTEGGNGRVLAVYDEACIPKVRFGTLSAGGQLPVDAAFAAYREEFFSRPFNLNEGETFHVDIVLSTLTNRYYIFANCHHIIADVYSFYEFVTRLSASYNEGPAHAREDLAASAEQYNALNNYIATTDERANAFIEKQVGDAQALDNFPVDYDKKEETAIGTLVMDAERKAAIEQYCQSRNISPFVFHLGCYHLFLHKVLQKETLLTGIPVANRPGKEFKEVMGYFVNTLPIASAINGQTPVEQLFRDLKAATFNLVKFKNANVKQVLHSKEDAAIGGSSLYDNLFTYYKQKLSFQLEGCTVGTLPVFRKSLHCPFTVIVEDGTEDTHVYFVKDSRILSELDLLSGYRTIVDEVLQPGTQTVSDIRLVKADEWEALLEQANVQPGYAVEHPADDHIYNRFEHIALKAPHRTACTFGRQSLSYGQLRAMAAGFGKMISRRLQGHANPNVALLIPVGIGQVVGIFSVLQAGKTYVPIDPSIPQQRIRYILDDTATALIVTTRPVAAGLGLPEEQCLFIDTAGQPAEEVPCATARHKDDIAYIIYTSGTTGAPKGVMVPHQNVLSLLDGTLPLFQFNEADKWSLLHSYAFDFSVWEIFGALLHGGTLVIAPDAVRKSHGAFWNFIREEGITVLNQTPSYFQQLIKEASAHPGPVQLRTVVFGGEKLIFNSLKNWTRQYPLEQVALINMYGITETTVHVTYHRITQEDIDRGRSLIGKAIPGWGVSILDADNRPLPAGATGEICVTGRGVALGYLNKAALTGERFIQLEIPGSGPCTVYRSGDLGRINADGNLEYFGRRDHQVKIRGFRIELKEIEKAMQEHPRCDIAAVKVVRMDDNDERLAGYYLSAGDTIPPQEMRRLLKEKLPQYMIPAHLFSMTAFPLTVNGKINYEALPLPGNEEEAENTVLETDTLETALVKITRSVLKTTDVHTEDNFFDLGGNSLLMIQFLNQVNALLLQRGIDVQLQVLDLYQYSTIKDLLESINSSGQEAVAVEEEAEDNHYQNRLQLLAQMTR